MINLFQILFKSRPAPAVVIVSGLPRSGTSMMMKILDAGGIPPLTDKIRTADPDNPKGYYEFERVKQLDKGDTTWLSEAHGRAVKVISALLQHLPADQRYKVIFMRREIDEILASQKKMLLRQGEAADKVSDEELQTLFQKHLSAVTTWLGRQPNIDFLYVSYNAIVADPQPEAERIARFLKRKLTVEKMAAVVDPALYRNRNQGQGDSTNT